MNDETAMTVSVPMTTPKTVKNERNLWPLSVPKASETLSLKR